MPSDRAIVSYAGSLPACGFASCLTVGVEAVELGFTVPKAAQITTIEAAQAKPVPPPMRGGDRSIEQKTITETSRSGLAIISSNRCVANCNSR